MVGYIKFLQRRGKITTRYKKLVYFVTPVRKARLQVFLLLFAPFGDDWREYCSYPQVPFPSVIPPAVIESWPPSGTGGYLRNLNIKYVGSQLFLEIACRYENKVVTLR